MSNLYGFVYDLETISYGHGLKIKLKRNIKDGVLFIDNASANDIVIANVTLK